MNTISSNSFISMMSPTTGISKSIVSQNDTNSDSSLSIDELGITEDQFSTLDSNDDSLVTQDEIASAIDNKLSSFNGEMPSKEEFASLLSDLGLEMPEAPEKDENNKAASDFSSLIISQYDSNGDSSLSSDEVSLLSSDEFSSLDSNGDGAISEEELSTAFEQVANSNNGNTQSAPPPKGGGGGMSVSQSEEYDELDTNKDGVVSQEEKNAALGISNNSEATSTSLASNQDTKDSIKLLLDTIKLNSQNSSEELDLSNFKNIMKMMNNQSNNSDLNTYVSNLSTSTSSKFSYA
jgi:Ca2+-binding EF-hand superfamily protein